MGDMIIGETLEEQLKNELISVKQENERIKRQNISLQQDLNKVIRAHNRAISIIDAFVEGGDNVKAYAKRETSFKPAAKRKKL